MSSKKGENNKKNVLILEHGVSTTGSFNAILGISIVLENDFNIYFTIPSNSSCIRALEKNNIKYYKVNYALVSKSIKGLFFFFPKFIILLVKLTFIIRRRKISLIHINDLYNIVPYFLKIFFPSVKIVTHVRLRKSSLAKFFYENFIKIAEKYADKIIVVSDIILKDNKLENNPKVVRIYDGLNIKEKLPFNYTPQDESGSIRILYLANYIHGKGHDIMIRAFAEAVKISPGLQLTMAGDDMGMDKNTRYKQSLINIALSLNVREKIIFMDRIDDIEPLFKSHQVFVNLSKYESFSFTCLESLFFGVPCIAYNSGGPAEILKGGKFGVLLKSRDTYDVSQALISLILDEDERVKLSCEGRKHVQKEFSFESTSIQYKNIYKYLLKE